MSAAVYDPGYVLEQYEALRREATTAARACTPGHGLVLFLTRGMTAWLEAITVLGPGAGPRRPQEQAATGRPAVCAGIRGELATVVAGMVLACAEEVVEA